MNRPFFIITILFFTKVRGGIVPIPFGMFNLETSTFEIYAYKSNVRRSVTIRSGKTFETYDDLVFADDANFVLNDGRTITCNPCTTPIQVYESTPYLSIDYDSSTMEGESCNVIFNESAPVFVGIRNQDIYGFAGVNAAVRTVSEHFNSLGFEDTVSGKLSFVRCGWEIQDYMPQCDDLTENPLYFETESTENKVLSIPINENSGMILELGMDQVVFNDKQWFYVNRRIASCASAIPTSDIFCTVNFIEYKNITIYNSLNPFVYNQVPIALLPFSFETMSPPLVSPPFRPPSFPPSPSSPPLNLSGYNKLCWDKCIVNGEDRSNNGVCEDGGFDPGEGQCLIGTDCSDCKKERTDVYAKCIDSCVDQDGESRIANGKCEDGGQRSVSTLCEFGADCTDCGFRAVQLLCREDCSLNNIYLSNNGICEDSSTNSISQTIGFPSICALGTDCGDCGLIELPIVQLVDPSIFESTFNFVFKIVSFVIFGFSSMYCIFRVVSFIFLQGNEKDDLKTSDEKDESGLSI